MRCRWSSHSDRSSCETFSKPHAGGRGVHWPDGDPSARSSFRNNSLPLICHLTTEHLKAFEEVIRGEDEVTQPNHTQRTYSMLHKASRKLRRPSLRGEDPRRPLRFRLGMGTVLNASPLRTDDFHREALRCEPVPRSFTLMLQPWLASHAETRLTIHETPSCNTINIGHFCI